MQPPAAGDVDPAYRPARRHGWRWWLVGLCCAQAGLLAQAKTVSPPPLLLVQPMDRTMAGNAVAQHFARWLPHYLNEPVMWHRPSSGGGQHAIAWAARAGVRDRSLVLLSQAWLSKLEALPPSTPGARGWEPLQMVLQGSWCLMAPRGPSLPDFAALHQWLKALGHPVRLGLPYDFGFPELWMQAMAQKTGLRWEQATFTSEHKAVEALATGKVDLALERCADMALESPVERLRAGHVPVQILAQSGVLVSRDVATFAQWKLPPLPGGWVAWFASAEMPLERREAVSKALYAIVLRDDTRALILSQHQVPVRLNPEGSRRFVQRSQVMGASLREWLEHSAHPLQEMDALVP